ncbi:MAG: hypothetical protein GY820_09720 [Gammaproteobacteria bacterium]|nr:hypothetical protein [Gammaproteobacteria bacterium]
MADITTILLPISSADLGAMVRAFEKVLSIAPNSYRDENPSVKNCIFRLIEKNLELSIHGGPKIANILKNTNHSGSFSRIFEGNKGLIFHLINIRTGPNE